MVLESRLGLHKELLVIANRFIASSLISFSWGEVAAEIIYYFWYRKINKLITCRFYKNAGFN